MIIVSFQGNFVANNNDDDENYEDDGKYDEMPSFYYLTQENDELHLVAGLIGAQGRGDGYNVKDHQAETLIFKSAWTPPIFF